MFLEVVDAHYLDGYRMLLSFNNGQKCFFDFTTIINRYPAFHCLSDLNLFKSFTITDTLEWNDGAIDIAPEYLLEHGIAFN